MAKERPLPPDQDGVKDVFEGGIIPVDAPIRRKAYRCAGVAMEQNAADV